MLDAKQRHALKGRAHLLKPVVIIGNQGVSPGVLGELNVALHAHELIKVRLPALEAAERAEMIVALTTASGADLVGRIGRIVMLYRPRSGA